MDKMPTILYLSGPITGQEDTAEKRFNLAASLLLDAGYAVMNPLDCAATDVPWATAMREDIQALTKCTGVALMEGWEESEGCNFEREVALRLDMPVAPIGSWLYRPEVGE